MLMMEPRMVGVKVEAVKVRQTVVGAKVVEVTERYLVMGPRMVGVKVEAKERYLVEAVHMQSMHSAAH